MDIKNRSENFNLKKLEVLVLDEADTLLGYYYYYYYYYYRN